MHRHECRLLSGVEPLDQLIDDVREPGKCLEIISLTYDDVFKHLGVFVRTTGSDDVLPLVKPTSREHCLSNGNSVGPLRCLFTGRRKTIFNSKSGSICKSKNSSPKQAWLGAMLPVNSFPFTVKDIVIRFGCFKPSLIDQSGNPSGPREVHLLYQLNWGVDMALRRSDMVMLASHCLAIITVT